MLSYHSEWQLCGMRLIRSCYLLLIATCGVISQIVNSRNYWQLNRLRAPRSRQLLFSWLLTLTLSCHSDIIHGIRKDARQGEIGHYRASVGRKTARLKWIVQPPLIIWRLAQFIFNYRQCQCLPVSTLLVWSEHLLAGGCEVRPGLVRSTIKISKLNLSHLWELRSI